MDRFPRGMTPTQSVPTEKDDSTQHATIISAGSAFELRACYVGRGLPLSIIPTLA
ncbi:hypothetical protein JCM15831A_02400 [Asaia astilbis]